MYPYDRLAWTSPAELKTLALGETPWRYYLDTVMYLETAGVRGTVSPSSAESSKGRYPPLGPLHVIAAVQPGSEPSSDESATRMDVLDGELHAAGITSIRAIGSSFDGNHREESRAVFGLNDASARRLGRRFGQVAVFGWSGPRWSLLACACDRQTHRSWTWEERTPLPRVDGD